jgi:hypothetical protein
MNVYEVSGLALGTELRFPELAHSRTNCAVARFEVISAPDSAPDGVEWFHTCCLEDGSRWLSFGQADDFYLLRFHTLADFRVSGAGDRIRCWKPPHTPWRTVRHLLLDQVIPLVLNLRGGEALHASAVEAETGACAFIGASGAGKSTLAASLASEGCPLLSDDCLALQETPGGMLALPSYRALRLWPDAAGALLGAGSAFPKVAHYTDKRLIGARGDGPRGPVRLARIYLLEPSGKAEAVSIARVSQRHALMKLVESAYRLDIRDRAMLARQFRFLARVVAKVQTAALRFPRKFAWLPAVREVVLRDLAVCVL